MNRADRCSVRTCWSFGVTQTNQFLGEVWVNERGQRISRPLTPRRSWLRGLDLNQRPLGYEYNTAMTGNPLISWERRSVAGSFTFSVDASFLLLFRPVSGCYGGKMGAGRARCVRHEPAPAVRCPSMAVTDFSTLPRDARLLSAMSARLVVMRGGA